MNTTAAFPGHKAPTVGSSARSGAITPTDFTVIADLVRARSGIMLGLDKAYLVESRLEQVVRNRRYAGLAEIAARLRTHSDGSLADDIVEAITTNETSFFRDTKPFEHLRRHLLVLHASCPPAQPLRIWSAAASSGQESYSVAITVSEAGLGSRPVQILGTDISAEQINRARLGLYSEFEVKRGLSQDSLNRYFRRTDMGWRINDPLRKLVEFRKWNLLDDLRPLGTFDLVFCRNVLIYFDLDTKRKVLDAIWDRLAPGGLLYLGGSETTFGVSDRFAPCRGSHQVYSAVRP
ncbi:MAG TPA: protein-glutamate O-methyltransferase CheR [Rhodopila sp.]